MTAYTQHAIANTRGNPVVDEIAIGTSNQIYLGSLVCQRNTTGRAFAGTAATGRKFVGYAIEFIGPNATGLGNTAGTERVKVAHGDEIDLAVQTSLRTNTTLHLNVFVKDSATVGGTAVGSAGTRLAVGELVSWVDETGTSKARAWIKVRDFAKTDIAV